MSQNGGKAVHASFRRNRKLPDLEYDDEPTEVTRMLRRCAEGLQESLGKSRVLKAKMEALLADLEKENGA